MNRTAKMKTTAKIKLTASYLLSVGCYLSLATCYLLLVSYHLLLATCYLILVTCHLLLAICCLLLADTCNRILSIWSSLIWSLLFLAKELLPFAPVVRLALVNSMMNNLFPTVKIRNVKFSYCHVWKITSSGILIKCWNYSTAIYN